MTLHYGDTIHAAPPPADPGRAPGRDRYRISAIVGYARPADRYHRGEHSYNEVLHRRDDGQVEHLVDVAAASDADGLRRAPRVDPRR